MPKSLEQYKSDIAAALQNNAVNTLIAELAARQVEIDSLKAELAQAKTFAPQAPASVIEGEHGPGV